MKVVILRFCTTVNKRAMTDDFIASLWWLTFGWSTHACDASRCQTYCLIMFRGLEGSHATQPCNDAAKCLYVISEGLVRLTLLFFCRRIHFMFGKHPSMPLLPPVGQEIPLCSTPAAASHIYEQGRQTPLWALRRP